jgi:SAM-dependent methyltransferase
MSPPVVSIVTIFFNAARFLEDAVASVLAQTYERWELLLVDDGSTDGSSEMGRALAARHLDRVRYLEHPDHANRGMSASRNLGIRHGRGDLVALLDADDVWEPEKLTRQVALLEAHPEVDLVYGAPLYWFGWARDPAAAGRDWSPDLPVPAGTVASPPELALASYPLGSGTAPCPSDLLFRRSLVDRVGGFEETFHGIYALYEDQAFLAKVYLNARVLVSGERWLRYRQHADSCVSVVNAGGHYETVRRFFLEWLSDYVQAHDVRDVRVRLALRRALRTVRQPTASRFETHGRTFVGRVLRLGNLIAHVLIAPLLSKMLSLSRPGDSPRVGRVRFGDLRRLQPVSREFGYDRGLPIDRYYIARFLAARADDIHGRVIEIGDDAYTRRFGGARVTRRDVLHVEPVPGATFVGDLACADHLPSDAFDCVILTQTLHLIYDVRAALATVHRILKPGGRLLATAPGISQISDDQWRTYWCWSFTIRSLRQLLTETFLKGEVVVEAYGNVLAAIAFLHGLAAEELDSDELAYRDPAYELLITAHARKAGGP